VRHSVSILQSAELFGISTAKVHQDLCLASVAPGGMESEWHEMVVGGINYSQNVVIIMKNSVTSQLLTIYKLLYILIL
jgi:hypothetical protein